MWAPSLRGPSRRAIDCNQPALAAVVESSLLRCRIATLNAILIEYRFNHGIWRTVVPTRIVIEVKLDRNNRAGTNIRASPTTGGRQELRTNPEVRVFHLGILAQRTRLDCVRFDFAQSVGPGSAEQRENAAPRPGHEAYSSKNLPEAMRGRFVTGQL